MIPLRLTMSKPQGKMGELSAIITSEIMVAVVFILFLILVVLFFLYLHAKGYHGAIPLTTGASQVRFILSPHRHPQPRRGLDPGVLPSLPVTIFHNSDAAFECSVCLCKLTEGEKARVLPTCKHGFHVKCIDMWFQSNDTCPLCRTLVSETTPHAAKTVEGEGSSSGSASCAKREGMLVIEIPRRILYGVGSPSTSSPLPLSSHAVVASPMSTRLRSLRRMLSGQGSTVVDAECACSTQGVDMVLLN